MFTPENNLILTGSLGGRVVPTAQALARLVDRPLFHLETEVQVREGRALEELRKLYGEAHARRIESELCREFGLRRGVVVSVPPGSLLDESNRERLMLSGGVVILTCKLNEALRRLHILHGARFQNVTARASFLHTLKQDSAILHITNLTQLETSDLSIDQTAEKALHYWQERETTP